MMEMKRLNATKKCFQFALCICLGIAIALPDLYAQSGAALIPAPQFVRYNSGSFHLQKCNAITIDDAALAPLATIIQSVSDSLGYKLPVKTARSKSAQMRAVALSISPVTVPSLPDEAYELRVTDDGVLIRANTAHGIFNGLQTLRQLINKRGQIQGVDIRDWPAFSWRGYMVDVGRNYQSMDLLKQQIDIMSRYKLNVFHFHLTEDIAWRLASKRYPQLTSAEYMSRNKGKYYSEQDMHELIRYCRDRFITFVPEIDMPGHSAAFTRAMGVDMQSDSGVVIVKNILKEFNETYDLPYMHIGADEVEIKNKDFVPEMVSLIQEAGRQTIGWYPGGNYPDTTIRQLWTDQQKDNPHARYIDSRNLYINHMDPLESVVTIFERQICDTTHGDKQMLGGEICLWHDRRVADEHDLFRMNPVYPSMLAFAERLWRGGGFAGTTVAIGDSGSLRYQAFREFEERLIDHKKKYFEHLPFAYVRQGDIQWKLFGPFDNNGDTKKAFWPEKQTVSLQDSVAAQKVTGGTVYLRHWWHPVLSSWLSDAKENTTWYAFRRIWKDKDTTGLMWIGFDNFSRSPATNSPQPGTWDSRESRIWVNGSVIDPPLWQSAGVKGNSELPLTDEGYEYREPALVKYKKGWNNILVKLPVKSFKGTDWQNPVKWMFTAVPVHRGEGVNMIADD